jgi:hypothetical protein
MSEGFRGIGRGIRPLDGLLAGVLTAMGAWLMLADVLSREADTAAAMADGTMVHELTSHSWLMVPVFALATVPVLWWRRSPVAVTGIALAVLVVHDLLFGWVTRCGAGLPLTFVLAYLGAVALELSRAWVVLGLSTLLTAAVLVRDATTGFDPSCSRSPSC